MKKNVLIVSMVIPALLLLVSCRKEKNDPFDAVSGKWLFKSITVETIGPGGAVLKTEVFDDQYETNDITLDKSGLYEVKKLPIYMYNATYCFKGEDSDNNHKGIWEFDSKKKEIWFDRGITEYFNSVSGFEFSLKYDYEVTGDKLTLTSADPKIIADFAYNVGKYYDANYYDMINDDYNQGYYDGYYANYWLGYYYGSPGAPSSDEEVLKKNAFYSFRATAIAFNFIDTSGAWQYPNYELGYSDGSNSSYWDGDTDAQNVDWINDKTYKMTIVYTKL